MRLLGIIRNIGEARQWMTQTGPVTIYPVTFEAEGNTFLGDLFASVSTITNRGICPGAVGYFDLAFKVRDVTTKAGEVYKRQDIRFSKWSLANQNAPAEAPATEQAPAADPEPAPAAPAAEAPQEAEQPKSDLPF